MFSTGSKMSFTPKRLAVEGISCIRPRAPLGEMASGLKFDSAAMTARTRLGSTPNFLAASRIGSE